MRIFPIFFIIYCFIFHKGLLFWALYIKKCLDDINQSLLLHNINNFIWYYSVVLFSIFCPLACRVHSLYAHLITPTTLSQRYYYLQFMGEKIEVYNHGFQIILIENCTVKF